MMPDQYIERYRGQAAEYGYGLTEEGFFTFGDKSLGVRLEIKKGRLRFVYVYDDGSEKLRASCSAKDSVGWFLERTWFAKKAAA